MKMYQAVNETTCIAEFGPELLPGWFASTQEALAAGSVAQSAVAGPLADSVAQSATPKKRGPKPKAK